MVALGERKDAEREITHSLVWFRARWARRWCRTQTSKGRGLSSQKWCDDLLVALPAVSVKNNNDNDKNDGHTWYAHSCVLLHCRVGFVRWSGGGWLPHHQWSDCWWVTLMWRAGPGWPQVGPSQMPWPLTPCGPGQMSKILARQLGSGRVDPRAKHQENLIFAY